MRYTTILIVAAMFVAGCDKPQPQETKRSSNPNYSVNLLFEHEGCRVYAFDDNGQTVYYANCGRSSDTSWNVKTEDVTTTTDASGHQQTTTAERITPRRVVVEAK